MIAIKNVTKKFHNKQNTITANDHLSLEIEDGQIYGILGQNGSGKTTLINQIIGLSKIDEGDILISGRSVRKNPKEGRKKCAVQVQGQLSFGELTPRRIITLMGEFRGGSKEEIRLETEGLLSSLAMQEWADKPGYLLSGGIKRLTSFCMAVIRSGDYIILDEPTNDVDPVRRKYLWNEIRKLADKGCCVVVVTHNILELEHVADKIAVIHQGCLIREGTIREIKQQLSSRIKMKLLLADSAKKPELPSWVLSSQSTEDSLTITADPSRISNAVQWAHSLMEKVCVLNYSFTETTLEDAYIHMVEKGA